MAKQLWIGSLILAGAAASALFLAGCRVPVPTPGSLTVEGATASADDAAKGFLTTVDCSPESGGQHATEVGLTSAASIPLLNSSDAEVEITGLELILTDDTGALVTHAQSCFTWAGDAPDVPLTIAAGKKAVFTVAFCSNTAGYFYGCLNINTSDGFQQVRLTGEAGWPVTLTVNSANTYGRITSPVTVTSAASVQYLCPSNTLTLTAETTDPVALTELSSWTSSGGKVTFTTAIDKLTVTADLGTGSGTRTITANFALAYLTWTPASGTLNSAVTSIGAFKGIALSEGIFTLSADLTLPGCLIRGGYATNFLSRFAYATEADRAARTRIQTNGFDLKLSGSTVTSSALMEGVQVTVTNAPTPSAELYPALAVENGAAPTLRSCTFIGAGGSVANSVGMYIYGSSPTVDSCVIKGSDTDATGGRSVGLWTTYSDAPLVTSCAISAGHASGADGKSYGLLNSSFASSPIIQGCTIDGGTGTAFTAAFWTGEGGRPRIENSTLFTQNAAASSYGVYIFSNGRLETLFGNNIYSCDTGLVFDYGNDQRTYTSIDDVNTDFVDDDQEANTSAAP